MKTEIMKKLEKELVFVEDFVGLIKTSSEKALDTQLTAMKILTERNKHLILLSTTRPCLNIISLIKKDNIDLNKVLIFDMAHQEQTYRELNEEKNVLHFHSTELTNLSIEINERINKNSELVIFLDSITTMLIHNKPDVFLKFIHSLLTKMRINKVCGLLLSFEKEETPVVEEIAQMCDKVIKV